MIAAADLDRAGMLVALDMARDRVREALTTRRRIARMPDAPPAWLAMAEQEVVDARARVEPLLAAWMEVVP